VTNPAPTRSAPLLDPGDVLPNSYCSNPECPFEVARSEGSTVAVL
jgi:hypothetical protein